MFDANDLAAVIVDAAVRGAVVLLLALALTYLPSRRSAATRHLIWVVALGMQVMLPVFSAWGVWRWEVAIPQAFAGALIPHATLAASPASVVVAEEPMTMQVSSASAKAQGSLAAAPSAVTAPETSRRWMMLWVVGAVLIALRLLVGTRVVANLARRGERIEDGRWLALVQRVSTALGIARPVTLLRGDRICVPVTWGIVYPVVLLPSDADTWSDERRRLVLTHEMAHVKRLDALTQLLGQAALAVFWFNPLVWVANRRMQMEREHACDDYVIRHGTAPSTYAEELLAMVRALGSADRSAQPAFAALAMARRSEFEGRMLSILDARLDRHPLQKGRAWTAALAALVLIVPLAALTPHQAAQNESVRRTETVTVPKPSRATERTASRVTVSASSAREAAEITSARKEPVEAMATPPVALAVGVVSATSVTESLTMQSRTALEAALSGMSSSGDKAAVLNAFGDTDNRETLLTVLRVAKTVQGSGDRSRLLSTIAPRYLQSGDADLIDAYFEVVAGIPSSGDKRSTLTHALEYADESNLVARGIIRAARTVSSSGDRAAVLKALVVRDVLTTPELQDEFLGAVKGIASSGDRSAVLQAAAKRFR